MDSLILPGLVVESSFGDCAILKPLTKNISGPSEHHALDVHGCNLPSPDVETKVKSHGMYATEFSVSTLIHTSWYALHRG
jgi:hypothetical protein